MVSSVFYLQHFRRLPSPALRHADNELLLGDAQAFANALQRVESWNLAARELNEVLCRCVGSTRPPDKSHAGSFPGSGEEKTHVDDRLHAHLSTFAIASRSVGRHR